MTGLEDKSSKVQNVAYRGYIDGSVDFFGPQIEVLTGYRRDEFLSRQVKWTDIIFEEDRHHVKNAFVQALKGDKTYSRQYRIRTKKGDVLWIQEWGQIVCDDQGKVEYVLGILVDITERKHSEELDLRIKKRTGKYLVFILNKQDFAVPIQRVKEIVGLLPITALPQAPPHIRGIINLRGKIIPVVDLHLRLQVDSQGIGERAAIIILDVEVANTIIPVGVLVDAVSEVLNIQGEHIEEMEEVFYEENSKIFSGMAKVDGKVKIILNVDRVIEVEDLETLPVQS
ncbi:chemotaxis protein CheW [Desulfosoma caldarium]|uniref:PAS domain S-box-containing protein n=1 Tax=Desulfosoma caldarium TaxID=610254 RepID=A0A3N1USG3_9BACT|nr:chemotaxis protein CheW [Desulfosoma caldarium]ROQ92329.1 PAS domain S-box-containing protein [Desulfosoma caldarium]